MQAECLMMSAHLAIDRQSLEATQSATCEIVSNGSSFKDGKMGMAAWILCNAIMKYTVLDQTIIPSKMEDQGAYHGELS